MNQEREQINNLYHKLGHQLIDKGIWFARNAYKLNPKVFTRGEVITFLADQLKLPLSTLSLADEKYHIESWGKWGMIIDFDLINQQIYLADVFDCDNFASVYSARASLIYGLNSCGLAYGNIYDPITKKYLFRHAFNLIVACENRMLKLYLYEPQTDEAMEWRKGQENALPRLQWIYKPDWVLMG